MNEETIKKLWDIAITSTFETKDYPNRVVMKDDLLALLKAYEQEKEKNKKLEDEIRRIINKLELEDYYNCQDGADDLTKLLKEVGE